MRVTFLWSTGCSALLLLVGIQLGGATDHRTTRLPGSELNLRLAAPMSSWDEAIPLGNGTIGVLLWGEGNTLRLSLDRGDLWDDRPPKCFVEVRDNFGGGEPQWNREGVRKVGENYEFGLKKGQVLEALFPKPKEIPPPPSNAAEPVVIRKS